MSIVNIPISEAAKHVGGRLDVLVCCASYEGRCLSLPRALADIVGGRVIVAWHENMVTQVSSNRDALVELFGDRGLSTGLDGTDPIKTADAIGRDVREAMRGCADRPRRLFIDTTTFTHESLLILIRTLQTVLRADDVALMGYAGASDYDPGHDDDEKWLSIGVDEVRSVLGYSGKILPSRKSHLVVLVGFEHERATKLVETFEPNRLSLGYGKPGTATGAKHQAANKRFHQLVADMVAKYAPVESFEFACNNPWQSKAAVLERVRLHSEDNVIVAPMNTKVSTVGCAMAAFEHQAIQLCYAQPARYNYANYSTPGDKCYVWDMSDELRRAPSRGLSSRWTSR